MHRFLVGLSLFLSCGVTAATQEMGARWEIAAQSSAVGIFNFQSSSRGFDSVFVAAGGSYLVNPWLQAGATTMFARFHNDAVTFHGVLFTAGPTFNLVLGEGGLTSAFFLSPQVGIAAAELKGAVQQVARDQVAEDPFVYSITLGKRFRIADSVAFAPRATLLGITKGDVGPLLIVMPLALTIHL